QALPERPELLAALFDLVLAENQPDEAAAVKARLARAGAPEWQLSYLQAQLLMHRGQWAEAAQLLERLRDRGGQANYLATLDLLLGRCYGQLGDTDRELSV